MIDSVACYLLQSIDQCDFINMLTTGVTGNDGNMGRIVASSSLMWVIASAVSPAVLAEIHSVPPAKFHNKYEIHINIVFYPRYWIDPVVSFSVCLCL